MTILTWCAGLILAAGVALAAYTGLRAGALEARYPPGGEFAELDGLKVHYRLIPAASSAPGALPVIFIHGASGSMRDALFGPAEYFSRTRPVIVMDRPGLGWSETDGRADLDLPDGQAQVIADLVDHLGFERAHVAGHSYGGAVAAAFALRHPEKLAGLIFLAPATHPWPGGVKWYYSLAAMPVLGTIFSWTLSLPVGEGRIACATNHVFAPGPAPADYAEKTAAALILTPARFRANARHVARLYDHVVAASPRYRTIAAPTLIVSGEADAVVYPSIHAAGLARDIPGAELLPLDDIGHMPHHAAADTVLPEMEAFMRRVERDGGWARAAKPLIAARVAAADKGDS